MSSSFMTRTAAGVSPSLNAATIFLTRPLALLGLSSSSLHSLQTFLQSSLFTTSALVTPKDPSSATHRLHLSPYEPAPLPIHLTCVAAGVAWEDWIRVLGGTSFTLIIKSTVVYVVRSDNGKVGVVWTIDPQDVSAVPSAFPTDFFTRRYTSDLVDEESDMISPIDTDSRPSSRASSYSNLSLKSSSSGSSQSSFASSVGSSSGNVKKAAAAAPAPAASAAVPVTKYIYQGGVSTVLTGGVMLGAAKSSKPASKQSPASARPKAATYTPSHSRSSSTTVEAIGSWRRSNVA